MTNNNYITNHKKCKHLTKEDRTAIYVLLNQGLSKIRIAKELGISRSTLYYELKRGTVGQIKQGKMYTKYFADTGQLIYERNRKNSRPPLKIVKADDFIKYVEEKIKTLKYSPDICYGVAQKEHLFDVTVCTKTIYNYIDAGLLTIKNIDLPLRVKINKKRHIIRKNRRILGSSIEERPQEVNERKEFGHWEIDTVIGTKAKSPVLLTLVERVTRKLITVIIPNKTEESVKRAIRQIYKQYGKKAKKIFKSITADNGVEFSNLKEAISSIIIYYAHPYSSYERGTNEKTNSLLRKFFPKGKSLEGVSNEIVQRAADYINHLPRKILNYTYSEDLFNQNVNNL